MKKLLIISAMLPSIALSNIDLDTQKVSAQTITEAEISNSYIISRAEIELLQASNLSEILTSLPGFQLIQQGGNAQTQSFSLNGFRSNQVLILLNGQRFGSATLGQTTYNTIPANIIERIEIVSNARSVIYGSDALGGVVNIITNQPSEERNSIRLAAGNLQTTQASVDLNKRIKNLSLHLSAFSEKSQGYDVLETNDNDNDGSERHAVGFDSRYHLNKEQSILASIQSNRGTVDYDGNSGTNRKRDYQQQSTNLSWQYSGSKYAATATAGHSFDKSWNYGNGSSRANSEGFITENKSLNINIGADITNNQSVLLVSDYRNENISESDAEYDETSGEVHGLGLSYRYNSEIINSEIGLRRDDATRFDENYSYSASFEWLNSNNLSIIAAINTGFKAPSFNDLYYPLVDYGSFGRYKGNSDLSPEKSLNRRLAIKYTSSRSIVSASYQLSHVEDLIQWQDLGGGENQPVNLDQALLRTATLTWSQNWSKEFTSQLSYDWTHAINLSNYNLLQRQSPRAAKLNLSYITDNFSLGSNIRSLTEAYDDAENSDLLAAYTVMDTYGDYTISNNFTIGIRLNNLLNKEYQTAKGYPAQERTYLVSGTFNF